MIGLLWPAVTILTAAADLQQVPYVTVKWSQSLVAAVAGLVLLLPEVLITALILLSVTQIIFYRLGMLRRVGWLELVAEPIVLLLALFWGACLWYPALLSHSWLGAINSLPAWALISTLALAVAFGSYWLGRKGSRVHLLIALLAMGLLGPVPLHVQESTSTVAREPAAVLLLGLDSVSQLDDVSYLREWIRRNDGGWYARPVTPALVTNAVWASVLSTRAVTEHGVFHILQAFPSSDAAVVKEAKRQGYTTVAVFPDQLTCVAGTDGGFDYDRSGPVGWRQVVVPTIVNASFALSLVKPVLPDRGLLASRANLAGTYTYSLRRELRELVAAPTRQKTFVAAHLTYLHIAAYPRYVDLTWSELKRVLAAPGRSLRDRSFDWQDVTRPTDPIALRSWKLRKLQAIVTEELERSGMVDAGAIAIFSDHGDRYGIDESNFTEDRYHRVVLATVGAPHLDTEAPFPLTRLGELIGITKSAKSAIPAVDHALAPPEMWPRLLETATIHWSGHVELDPGLLEDIRRQLRRFVPYEPGDDDSNSLRTRESERP